MHGYLNEVGSLAGGVKESSKVAGSTWIWQSLEVLGRQAWGLMHLPRENFLSSYSGPCRVLQAGDTVSPLALAPTVTELILQGDVAAQWGVIPLLSFLSEARGSAGTDSGSLPPAVGEGGTDTQRGHWQ